MASVIARRNFGVVLESCALMLGERYGNYTSDGITAISGDKLTRIKQLVNDAIVKTQDVIVENTGSIEKISGRIVAAIDAPKTSGATVAITTETATATLSAGSVLASTDVNRHIKLDDKWFRITDVSDPDATIECNYNGDSLTAADLAIYSIYHQLATPGTRMFRMANKKTSVIWPDAGQLKLVDEDYIFAMDPEFRDTSATPSHAAFVNYQGETRLLLWPIPTAKNNVIIRGVVMATVLSSDASFPDLPEEFHLLWESIAKWLVAKEYATEDIITVVSTDVSEALKTLGLTKKASIGMYTTYDDSDISGESEPWFPGVSLEIST